MGDGRRNDTGIAVLRFCLGMIVALSALLAALITAEFRTRLPHETAVVPLPSSPLAVVFTGQFERITLALALFEAGGIDRLLISGVNPEAGLDAATLAARFGAGPRVQAALAEGRIRLSPDAADTFDNATEAACWLVAQGAAADVLLITSPAHMPRASLALERAAGHALGYGFPVLRQATEEALPGPQALAGEFWKFAYTWLATLPPPGPEARAGLSLCRSEGAAAG